MNKKSILRIAAAVSAALLLGGFYFYFKDDISQDKAEDDLLPFRPIMVSQGTLDEITDDLMKTTAVETAVDISYITADEEPAAVTVSDIIPNEVRQSLMESVQSLNEAYPDAIGWLYIPNTNIAYPITQGRDNEYYLSHAYDGSSLKAGTIFLDCRCENRFMNPVNILYGHSMKNGTMFAGVLNFADSSYFESHRYGWLATPETVYRIDFFSCAKTDYNDELYDGNTPISEWIPHICEKSVVQRETEYTDNDRFISLSTCSYEFKNARTVLTGRLVEMTGGR
ncbi:class B sortase [Ruminococcus flavefaciens]|uniref:class B sortase n=1 Tax=Ruminococcus flavefaciens TaxID=1265 RepID=UPI0026EB792D|nr:class B sortase [Ruminococcus flavefaciens]